MTRPLFGCHNAVRRHRPRSSSSALITISIPLYASAPRSKRTTLIWSCCHAATADPERIRSAMRAATETSSSTRRCQLAASPVREAPREAVSATDQGQVVAIIGAKGVLEAHPGVNLAAELAPVHRVCVADLDFSMGDVVACLTSKAPAMHVYWRTGIVWMNGCSPVRLLYTRAEFMSSRSPWSWWRLSFYAVSGATGTERGRRRIST